MASRGGGGRGGRGGRGGGRGGRGGLLGSSLMGGLTLADVQAVNPLLGDGLYPQIEPPDTEYPTEDEAKRARKYNELVLGLKGGRYWLESDVGSASSSRGVLNTHDSVAVPKYSDRFLAQSNAIATTSASAMRRSMQDLATSRSWHLQKDMLPATVWEGLFEERVGEKRKRIADEARRAKRKVPKLEDVEGLAAEDGAADGDRSPSPGAEGKEGGSEDEDELPLDADEDDEDEDQDYGNNYFDNGEGDDDFGGGGDGGDGDGGGDDGGTY